MNLRLLKMLFIFALCSLIGIVNSICDVCVNRLCHNKKILMKDIRVTDQLVVDRTNNILYLQINSNMNTALYLEDNGISKIEMVQILNTSGMAFKQNSQELYTADHNTIYKISHANGSTPKIVPITGIINKPVNLLHFENTLYFTVKGEKNLYFVDGTSLGTKDLANFTIKDFVKTKSGITFVTDDGIVYEYKDPYDNLPEVLVRKPMILAADKNDDVYLGEASQNIIFKKDSATNELTMYAAYACGSVAKFTFDKFNNLIVYDRTEKSLVYWTKQTLSCTIEPPRCTYHIKIDNDRANHIMTIDPPVNKSEEPAKIPKQEIKISKGEYENFAQFWTALR